MKNKKGLIVISSMLFMLLLGGIVLSIYFTNNSNAEVGTKANDSKEVIESRMQKKVDKSILAVTMDQIVEFEDGNSEGHLNIENLPENNYEIEVEIQDKKKETIYKSERIKPGMIIRKDKLDEKLKKGDYLCSAIFKAFDDDGNEIRSASAQIQITIKK